MYFTDKASVVRSDKQLSFVSFSILNFGGAYYYNGFGRQILFRLNRQDEWTSVKCLIDQNLPACSEIVSFQPRLDAQWQNHQKSLLKLSIVLPGVPFFGM